MDKVYRPLVCHYINRLNHNLTFNQKKELKLTDNHLE